jgi:hypothetical protein
MRLMFMNAVKFSHSLHEWNLADVPDTQDMFTLTFRKSESNGM